MNGLLPIIQIVPKNTGVSGVGGVHPRIHWAQAIHPTGARQVSTGVQAIKQDLHNYWGDTGGHRLNMLPVSATARINIDRTPVAPGTPVKTDTTWKLIKHLQPNPKPDRR